MNQPREFSNPLLWTAGLAFATIVLVWVFAHWMGIGERTGRDHGVIQLAPSEASKPVDHQALIADRSQAVLDRGRTLFRSNCAACHGPEGDQNATGSNPAPRNLKKEAFKAEWGGGPVGLYLTMTKGWGQGMPAFSTLPAEDRYAIAHFIRETWVKGGDRYVEKDPPNVLAQVEQPAAATATAETGPRIPADQVEQPGRVHPLMHVVATEAVNQVEEVASWIAAARAGAKAAERPVLDRIAAAGARHPAWLMDLRRAAQGGDHANLAAVLLSADSGDPDLALLPQTSVETVCALLVLTTVRT